jgi:hypothetical protein
MWMHPGSICRPAEDDNESLLKVRGKSYSRPRSARWEAAAGELSITKWVVFFSFLVLGFELGAYTLSHSTSPLLCRVI